VPAPRLVLGHHQPDETLVLEVVGEGELDDAADGGDGIEVIQVEEPLGLADLRAPLKPRAANSSMAARMMRARLAAGALGLRIAALRAAPGRDPLGIDDIAR
jgi:hypothetical protein